MARRAVGRFIDTYLQHYLRRKEQDHQSELVQQRQMEMAQAQFANNILESFRNNPGLAARMAQSGVRNVGPFPINAFVPTQAENMGVVSKDLEAKNTLAELPTDIGLERAYGAQPGADSRDPRPIEELIAQRKAREAQIKASLPPTSVTHYDPATRTKVQEYVSSDPTQLVGKQFQQEPTPAQAGENKLLEYQQGEGSPAYTLTKAQATNELNAGTQRSEANKAGAISAAQAGGAARAVLAPDIVSGQVDRAGRIAKAETDNRGGLRAQSTEGEKRAASQLVPLTQAHLKMLDLEKKGNRLQPMATYTVGSPAASGVNSVLNGLGGFGLTEGSLQYAQALQDFITTFGYMRSGVAINKEEIPRFQSIIGVNENDPPHVAAQKQASRATLLNAVQILTGRESFDAGRALATAFLQGQLDKALVPTLEFTDPEFKRGFQETFKVPEVR